MSLRRVLLPMGLLLLLLWGPACGGPGSKGELLFAPDSKRTGKGGMMGPFGVGKASWIVQARVAQGFEVDVLFPATKDGALDRSQAPYPTIVLVHGGLVPASRYQWLAEHFASRGYVVVAPSHLASLAVFEYDNAWLSLQALRKEATQIQEGLLFGAIEAKGKVVVMGHSLGGVIAAWQWSQHSEIEGVALLASWPADGTDTASRAGSPVLSVIGANEPKETVSEAREKSKLFQKPVQFGLIKDMNHYDWTDGATPSELAKDGPPSSDLAKVRTNVFRLLDVWLDATLLKDRTAQASLESDTFAGIELER